ncbi:MAG: META domain-containing protein [Pseudomonadales bacterium]
MNLKSNTLSTLLLAMLITIFTSLSLASPSSFGNLKKSEITSLHSQLTGNRWELLRIFKNPKTEWIDWRVENLPKVIFEFKSPNHLWTSSLCNSLTWNFNLKKEGKISVKFIESTLSGCSPNVGELEDYFARELTRSTAIKIDKITKKSSSLTIYFDDGGYWEFIAE